MQEFVDILVNKLLMEEPTVPVNEECVAPELPAVTSSDCLEYPDVFSGDIEESPAPKIAHAIQFGFDVDTLEIHLHELYDVLDYFFIIEATKTNNKEISKPLLWEQLKRTPRFAMFQEKIVHLVLDDAEFSISPSSDKWEVEKRQEVMRWKKIQQWNEANDNPLTDRDLIGFGDADEVASRWNVHLLKHCVQKSTSAVDIGIWFPMGDLSKALKTDHPVGDHAFTLGDPTYFKISGIKEDQIPNRARGHSDDYLLGGIHLTHYLSGPQLLIKHLTCTECMAAGPKRLARYQKGVKDGKSLRDVAKGEHASTIEHYSKSKRNPLIPLDKAREDNKDDFDRIVYTPWFMKCNKERFPGWYALEDRHTR